MMSDNVGLCSMDDLEPKQPMNYYKDGGRTMVSCTRRVCPVCNLPDDAELIHTVKLVPFEDSGFPGSFDVVACSTCGMVYSDVPVAQPKLDEGYANRSKYVQPPRDSEIERRRQEQTARTILSLVGRDSHILDVGCATGSLLKALGELGCTRLVGMDPSRACLDTASVSIGSYRSTALVCGTLDKPPSVLQGVGFDVVILSHVLEHIADVPAALKAVTALLKDDGLAYIEVPDASRYLECLSVPFGDFNTEHINHFSGRHLARAASRAGLRLADYGFKTFPPAEGHQYPAVYGAFRKGNLPEGIPGKDSDSLKESVRAYAEASSKMWSVMEARLMADLAGRQPIVWGCGELTYKLLAGPLGRLGVRAFVDTNPIYHKRKLLDCVVANPEILVCASQLPAELKTAWETAPILAAGIYHRDGIVAAIRELCLPNPIVTLKPEVAR